MSSLSSQSYKGTRDYYPADKREQNYIFSTWRTVVERHGYEEYGAPLIEPLDVYTAKSGQELANEQTYAFTDRGDRLVAIRPEMTPSISRMVAARRQELGYPARLYSIANFMRYERPQRGREREFWQLNLDMFGVESVLAEAEMITLASTIMKSFGASDKTFTIKVNDRRLINFMMTHYLGLDTIQSQLMIKLFDRKSKIPMESFRDEAAEILGDKANEGLPKIARLLSATSMADLPQEIRETETVADVQKLFSLLEQSGIDNVRFDITLMRGLDYYTGTVFEVFDDHPDNNRSVFGGGRYDGLVGLFGAEPISTIGFGLGATTMHQFLEVHNLLPEIPSTTEVGVVVLEDGLSGALALARQLRDEGVNVEVDISGRKLDKQIKAVIKKQIPFMVFVGKEEIETKQYPFKDTKTTDEAKLSFERIVTSVKDRRHNDHDEFDDLFS